MDEAVVRRLIEHVGGKPGDIYGGRGKQHILRRINGYNQAAQYHPWVVLVDLDQDAICAPAFRRRYLPNPASFMCFRIAVRAVEAWLMADREAFSDFFKVALSRIPENPELELDPRRKVIDLIRYSRRSVIREDMIPRPGSRRSVGPAYSSRLIEYIEFHWRPNKAARVSDSLARCIDCLRCLLECFTALITQ